MSFVKLNNQKIELRNLDSKSNSSLSSNIVPHLIGDLDGEQVIVPIHSVDFERQSIIAADINNEPEKIEGYYNKYILEEETANMLLNLYKESPDFENAKYLTPEEYSNTSSIKIIGLSNEDDGRYIDVIIDNDTPAKISLDNANFLSDEEINKINEALEAQVIFRTEVEIESEYNLYDELKQTASYQSAIVQEENESYKILDPMTREVLFTINENTNEWLIFNDSNSLEYLKDNFGDDFYTITHYHDGVESNYMLSLEKNGEEIPLQNEEAYDLFTKMNYLQNTEFTNFKEGDTLTDIISQNDNYECFYNPYGAIIKKENGEQINFDFNIDKTKEISKQMYSHETIQESFEYELELVKEFGDQPYIPINSVGFDKSYDFDAKDVDIYIQNNGNTYSLLVEDNTNKKSYSCSILDVSASNMTNRANNSFESIDISLLVETSKSMATINISGLPPEKLSQFKKHLDIDEAAIKDDNIIYNFSQKIGANKILSVENIPTTDMQFPNDAIREAKIENNELVGIFQDRNETFMIKGIEKDSQGLLIHANNIEDLKVSTFRIISYDNEWIREKGYMGIDDLYNDIKSTPSFVNNPLLEKEGVIVMENWEIYKQPTYDANNSIVNINYTIEGNIDGNYKKVPINELDAFSLQNGFMKSQNSDIIYLGRPENPEQYKHLNISYSQDGCNIDKDGKVQIQVGEGIQFVKVDTIDEKNQIAIANNSMLHIHSNQYAYERNSSLDGMMGAIEKDRDSIYISPTFGINKTKGLDNIAISYQHEKSINNWIITPKQDNYIISGDIGNDGTKQFKIERMNENGVISVSSEGNKLELNLGFPMRDSELSKLQDINKNIHDAKNYQIITDKFVTEMPYKCYAIMNGQMYLKMNDFLVCNEGFYKQEYVAQEIDMAMTLSLKDEMKVRSLIEKEAVNVDVQDGRFILYKIEKQPIVENVDIARFLGEENKEALDNIISTSKPYIQLDENNKFIIKAEVDGQIQTIVNEADFSNDYKLHLKNALENGTIHIEENNGEYNFSRIEKIVIDELHPLETFEKETKSFIVDGRGRAYEDEKNILLTHENVVGEKSVEPITFEIESNELEDGKGEPKMFIMDNPSEDNFLEEDSPY